MEHIEHIKRKKMWKNIEKNNKEEQMKKFIGCIVKNYKCADFVLQSEGTRIMIFRTRGWFALIQGRIKAFYHFNFIEMSVSSSFWANKSWIHSIIYF